MNEEKSEFGLIDWIARQGQAAAGRVLLGIGDDCAIVDPQGHKVLITTDLLLEGTHFDLSSAPLEQVGYKAMACSLSDCAAMAAVPLAAVTAVSLPRHFSMEQARQLHQGMQRAGEKYGCPLIGGDTTSWPGPLTVSVTMLATDDGIEPLRRSGAKAGDVIFVTGMLGGSIQGKHLTFEPRVREARFLAKHGGIHALMDISDGLASDLRHICRQSGTAACLDLAAVPISPVLLKRGDARQTDETASKTQAGCPRHDEGVFAPLDKTFDPLRCAFTDGEDFELLGCCTPGDFAALQRLWPGTFDLPLTAIGRMMPPDQAPGGQTGLFYEENGELKEIAWRGWEHFTDHEV